MHCFHNNAFKELRELRADNNTPDLPLWIYFQVCSYLKHTSRKSNLSRQMTELESVGLEGKPLPKVTSLSYAWIEDYCGPCGDRFRESWSEALGIPISCKQWQRACIFTHECSLSTRTQETAYKLLNHWYTTPVKLHSWFPLAPDTCWHCQTDKGTLFHIWWQCPLLSPFGSKVREIISQITETKLLHITDFSFKKYKNSLSKHLLNADKSLIPHFWKSQLFRTGCIK